MQKQYKAPIQVKKKLETYPFLFTFNKHQFINTTTIKERLSRKPHNLHLPHRTEFYVILLFTEGSGKHMVDFNHFEAKKGHLLLVSQSQVHAFNPNESYDGRALIFTESFFCRSERDKAYFKNSLLFNDIYQPYFNTEQEYEELKSIFIKIYDELQKPVDNFQGELLHNLLYRIFLISERQWAKTHLITTASVKNQQLITRFRQLVEQNYKVQREVNFYAKELSVSVRTLQKATELLLGKTPKQWINNRIILEIKRILAYGSLSIKEIAIKFNYEEPTNFAKFFKEKTGLTPSELRVSRELCH